MSVLGRVCRVDPLRTPKEQKKNETIVGQMDKATRYAFVYIASNHCLCLVEVFSLWWLGLTFQDSGSQELSGRRCAEHVSAHRVPGIFERPSSPMSSSRCTGAHCLQQYANFARPWGRFSQASRCFHPFTGFKVFSSCR